MPTFDELRARYFSDSTAETPLYENSSVEPFLFTASRGKRYFEEMAAAIGRPGVTYLCLAGWWLDPAFSLAGPRGAPRLIDLLKAKSRQGVDVRVLGWVMAPELLRHSLTQSWPSEHYNMLYQLNGDTLRFIEELRNEPTMRDKACVNILSHPAGAVHVKMVIVGREASATGFTGGIDLESRRHEEWWHDVEAKVTGPAIQGLYSFFREMWNEIRSRGVAAGLTAQTHSGRRVTIDSHTPSMPLMSERSFNNRTGSMVVQSASTLPQFNFYQPTAVTEYMRDYGYDNPLAIPVNTSLRYAPHGRTAVKTVWERAINQAQRYIYIEDQGFTATDVLSWINAAIRSNDELQVVLVTGGSDPAAPMPIVMKRVMSAAFNSTLLNGLNAAQADRIGLFRYHRTYGTTASSMGSTGDSFTKFIHSKSTIIDDEWAIVGSANCMRRSLYMDFEHAVAFMDPDGAVARYRLELWAEHLESEIPNIDVALRNWFTIPFISGRSGNRLGLERVPLYPRGAELQPLALTNADRILAGCVLDADSRQQWGAELVSESVRLRGL